MNDPPEIAVGHPAKPIVFHRARRGHFRYPCFGYDALSGIGAVLQTEQTDLRHIRGAHTQPVAGRTQSLRIGKPDIALRLAIGSKMLMLLRRMCKIVFVIRNAQRTKQRLIGEIHGIHASRARQNAGQDMQAYGAIIEITVNSAPAAEKIQRSVRPVFAGTDLRPRIALSLVGRAHGQKVFDRYILDRLFPALYGIFRKIGKHAIFNASDHAAIDRNPRKQRHHTLGGGHDVRTIRFAIAVPFRGIDLASILNYCDLADIRLPVLNTGVQFFTFHGAIFLRFKSFASL